MDDDVSTAAPVSSTSPQASVSRLPLYVIGGLVAVALIVTLIIASRGGSTDFEQGSPEATVQAFIQASIDDDWDAALAQLTPQLARRCEGDESRFYSSSLRAILDEVDVEGDSARVSVKFRDSGGSDPFESNSYDFIEVYSLVREGDSWRLSSVPWPWQIASCARADS